MGTRFDQLNEIVRQLREDTNSRRAVLDMWNPGTDLFVNPSKDKCCNLCACFVIRGMDKKRVIKDWGDAMFARDEIRMASLEAEGRRVQLDMTVFNRSNDMIWGMLGANVVHFSMLQQYMADRIGVPMGRYHQITNDMHVYTERWEPEKWLEEEWSKNYYPDSVYETMPILLNERDFDKECREFVDRHSKDSIAGDYSEPFLSKVAQPMCIAFHHHKRREYNRALQTIEAVEAADWRKAGREWLQRRKVKWEVKQ